MPEIIEVKKYADFIRKILLNKILLNISIINGRYKKHGPFDFYKKFKSNLPSKIINIGTKGKLMYISFYNDYHIIVTLGLSGGWLIYNKKTSYYYHADTGDVLNESLASNYYKLMYKHRNVLFETEKHVLYFCDILSFGTIKIYYNKEDLHKRLSKLGPDIMDITTNFDIFKNQIRKPNNLKKQIGIVLLNQKIISGIGNYLRADILWLSRISPFRPVKKLSDNDLLKIYNNSKAITWHDYDYKKALEYNYIDKKIKFPKDYNRNFFVYNQERDIYNNEVITDELYEGSHKRYIHWVPKLQL